MLGIKKSHRSLKMRFVRFFRSLKRGKKWLNRSLNNAESKENRFLFSNFEFDFCKKKYVLIYLRTRKVEKKKSRKKKRSREKYRPKEGKNTIIISFEIDRKRK